MTTAWPRVVAKCAEMGVFFDSWQHGIGTAALGKRADGKYATTVNGVVLSIPRQVGKTFLVGMIIIALCVLVPNTTVLWTAHRTRTATKTFKSMQGYVRRKKIARYLKKNRNDGIRTSNGEQEIEFSNGSIIMFGARADGFGRGFDEVDIEVFDEAQILDEKALEDMVPAANQSRNPAGALMFFMGTPPRPVDKGEEFRARRAEALDAPVVDGVGYSDGLMYVEFSADEDADPDDEAQWTIANPSYPLRTSLEAMQRMRANLKNDDSFKREALGIWDPLDTPRVIDEESWNAVADPASMAIERLTLAIDVAPDRSVAAVSLAGLRSDGVWHIELDDARKRTDWIAPVVEGLAKKNRLHAVVLDELSGLVELRKNGKHYLEGTDVVVTLAASEGRDMAIACQKYFDAVIRGTVRHPDQPQLNVAISVARKRNIGAAWGWNRKDATSDITPVVSSTLALWGAQKDDVERPTRRQSERTAVIL